MPVNGFCRRKYRESYVSEAFLTTTQKALRYPSQIHFVCYSLVLTERHGIRGQALVVHKYTAGEPVVIIVLTFPVKVKLGRCGFLRWKYP